jgi:RNA polymerase sigma factor (sigma-70 family)
MTRAPLTPEALARRNAVILVFTPLADIVARKLRRTHGRMLNADCDELRAIALERLVEASGAIEPYLRQRVEGAIRDAARPKSVKNTEPIVEVQILKLRASGPSPEEIAIASQEEAEESARLGRVMRGARQLHPRDRQVLVMRARGASGTEIGARIGRSKMTVSRIERRVVDELRRAAA